MSLAKEELVVTIRESTGTCRIVSLENWLEQFPLSDQPVTIVDPNNEFGQTDLFVVKEDVVFTVEPKE
jgi:hypothetical protein